MMVQWSHSKDPFARQLERSDLQNHGNRLDNKNAADREQQNLLLDDYGNGADRSAQRKRTHVAHKHFRRMRVVPEKPKRRPGQRAAKNDQFARIRNPLYLEVIRKFRDTEDYLEIQRIASPSRPSVRFTAFEQPT